MGNITIARFIFGISSMVKAAVIGARINQIKGNL